MGIDLTGEDLIRKYFQFNTNNSIDGEIIRLSDEDVFIPISSATAEGVSLGSYLDNGALLLKTFITYDMANGGQIDIFNEINEKRIAHHEEYLRDRSY